MTNELKPNKLNSTNQLNDIKITLACTVHEMNTILLLFNCHKINVVVNSD